MWGLAGGLFEDRRGGIERDHAPHALPLKPAGRTVALDRGLDDAAERAGRVDHESVADWERDVRDALATAEHEQVARQHLGGVLRDGAAELRERTRRVRQLDAELGEDVLHDPAAVEPSLPPLARPLVACAE